MKTEYLQVDENGFLVDSKFISEDEQVPSNCFPGWGDRVLHKPVWDFELGDWKEGLTPEEIYNLTKPKPITPSETERIDALEFMLMDMMMKQQMQEMMDMEPPDLKL